MKPIKLGRIEISIETIKLGRYQVTLDPFEPDNSGTRRITTTDEFGRGHTTEIKEPLTATCIIRRKTIPKKSLLGKSFKRKGVKFVVVEIGIWMLSTDKKFKSYKYAAQARLMQDLA